MAGITSTFITGTTGQVLQATTNASPVWSTATYPATAGTSGNVLTSNGTNFISQAPATATIYFANIATGEQSAPLDGTTYYFSSSTNWAVNASNSSETRYYIPFNCTINIIKANFYIRTTLGSNENGTLFLRLNDTTNTNISTSVQLTAINNAISVTNLNLSVVAGDYLTWGFTCPTWGTNPTNVGFSGVMST